MNIKKQIVLTEELIEKLSGFISFSFLNFTFKNAEDLMKQLEIITGKPALIKGSKFYNKMPKPIQDGWLCVYNELKNTENYFESGGNIMVEPIWVDWFSEMLLFYKHVAITVGATPFQPFDFCSKYGIFISDEDNKMKDVVETLFFEMNSKRAILKDVLSTISSGSTYYCNIDNINKIEQIINNNSTTIAENKKFLKENFILKKFSKINLKKFDFEKSNKIIFYDDFKDV